MIAGAARSLAGRIYRASAAPFGRRALGRMLERGFPAHLAPPLEFLFTGRLEPFERELARDIERLRGEIAARRERYRFELGSPEHGMSRWPVVADDSWTGPHITSAQLANAVSVPSRWGMFLHLCAEAVAARTILELGACVGISGAYLASVRSCRQFVTVEGSAPLAKIAESSLARFSKRATVIQGPFENTLREALDRLGGALDFAFVDGHHSEPATLHYVRTLLPHLANPALVVVDDISLYDEMQRAWKTLTAMEGVAVAINAGRVGILVCESGAARPRTFDLSKYTGWWRASHRV
jgi:predicted O-methyltransferase YrrM